MSQCAAGKTELTEDDCAESRELTQPVIGHDRARRRGRRRWRSRSWWSCWSCSAGAAPYTLHADFQDASGLVTGNHVMIGPANVGTVQSIALTPNGQAQVTIALDSSAAPLHEGTVARIYENSLSGIANRYVVLEPGAAATRPRSRAAARSARTTRTRSSASTSSSTRSTRSTRAGLRGFIQGEAASIQGKARRHEDAPVPRARRSRARAT